MAVTRYWRPGTAGHQGDGTFESDDFNDAEDGSGNWGQPDGEDDPVVFDDHPDCGACAVDASTVPIYGLTMTGYANTMTFSNAAVFDVQGNATLDGTIAGAGNIKATGNIVFSTGMSIATNVIVGQVGTSGTPTIAFNGVTGIDLEIDNDGVTSCLAQDAVDLSDFVLFAGKYSDGGHNHSVSNECLPGGGEWTTNGAWDLNCNFALSGLASWAGVGDVAVSDEILGEGDTTVTWTGGLTWDGAAAKDLTYDAMHLPLTVTGAGALTAQDAGYLSSFTVNTAAGSYVADSHVHTAYGAVTYTQGICQDLPLVIADDLTIDWYTADNPLGSLKVNQDKTLTGRFTTQQLLNNGGTDGAIDLNETFCQVYATANNPWTFAGDISNGEVGLFSYAGNYSNAALVDCGTASCLCRFNAARTLTLTGGLTCAALLVRGNGAYLPVLDMNGGTLAAGAVTLGVASGTTLGKIDFGEATDHAITSLARSSGNTGTGHEVDFVSALIQVAGTVDGTGITVSNTSARLANSSAAVVQDVDASGTIPLNCVGCKSGGGNTNVYFQPGGTGAATGVAA